MYITAPSLQSQSVTIGTMPKKKILYVITKSNWGGAQKYVFDLATSLPKDRYEVTVAMGGNGPLKDNLDKEKIETTTIESLDRNISIIKDLRVIRELLSIYKKIQPDVIHLNSSKIGLLGSIAFRIYKIKSESKKMKAIFTVHGWAFNEKRNFLFRFIIWKMSALTSWLCTDIITLSKKEEAQAQRLPLTSSNKIHLIRNGLKDTSPLSKEASLQALGLNPSRKYVGTISELHPNKGLDVLIRCAPALEADVVIIGEGEERLRLQALANTLHISEKIHFLGTKKQAGLYITAFDVFTLTSRKEGLPYALLEAGIAGVPAVASNVGGIPEIIIDGQTGILVEPENPRILLQAIEAVLQDPAFGKHLGENARNHIQNNFSFEKTLFETQKIYS